MKNILAGIAGALAFSFVLVPFAAHADLASDLRAQIASLTAQLNAILVNNSSAPFCHTFSGRVGNSGAEVTALQTALHKEGFSTSLGGIYDAETAAAVARFQGKNGIFQTGSVGPLTRARLNSIYGCINGSHVVPLATDTGSMQTYADTQYGFSFQYPKNLVDQSVINHSSIILALGHDGSETLTVEQPKVLFNSGSPETFSEFSSKYDQGGYVKTNLTVGGIQSIAVYSPQIGYIVSIPLANNSILQIEGRQDDPVLKQLLASFVFTNPATAFSPITVTSPVAGINRENNDGTILVQWTDTQSKKAPADYVIGLTNSYGKNVIATVSAVRAGCLSGGTCSFSWNPQTFASPTNNVLTIYDRANDPSANSLAYSASFSLTSY